MVKAIYIRLMTKRNIRQISFEQIRYNFDVDDIVIFQVNVKILAAITSIVCYQFTQHDVKTFPVRSFIRNPVI